MGRIFYNPNTSGSLEVLTTDPTQPTVGDHWLNTTEGVIKYFDGQSIKTLDEDQGAVCDVFGNDIGIDA